MNWCTLISLLLRHVLSHFMQKIWKSFFYNGCKWDSTCTSCRQHMKTVELSLCWCGRRQLRAYWLNNMWYLWWLRNIVTKAFKRYSAEDPFFVIDRCNVFMSVYDKNHVWAQCSWDETYAANMWWKILAFTSSLQVEFSKLSWPSISIFWNSQMIVTSQE